MALLRDRFATMRQPRTSAAQPTLVPALHLSLPSRLPVQLRRLPAPPRSAPRDDSAQQPSAGTAFAASSLSTPSSAASATSAASAAAAAGRSGAALLESLRSRGASPATRTVYDKPLTKSEVSALEALLAQLRSDPRGAAAAAGGEGALREHLMGLLLESATRKRTPLPVVEGAMVALEMLVRDADSATAAAIASGLSQVAPRRWQLVVGADVGAVQYIPAVEELEVSPDGSSFTLGTDLDFIFTGFRGPCRWLAPGHLSYDVRHVRLELRAPKAWRRAAAWLAWRRAGSPGGEPAWGDSLPTSPTCREDPGAPGALLPLPFFPTNEILAFLCDGRLALTRSRLTGGLILLLDVPTREAFRAAEAAEAEAAKA